MADRVRTRAVVTHDEAHAIAQRFIDGHFGNAGEHPRVRIPADAEHDDDLRLMDYIEQQRALEKPPLVTIAYSIPEGATESVSRIRDFIERELTRSGVIVPSSDPVDACAAVIEELFGEGITEKEARALIRLGQSAASHLDAKNLREDGRISKSVKNILADAIESVEENYPLTRRKPA